MRIQCGSKDLVGFDSFIGMDGEANCTCSSENITRRDVEAYCTIQLGFNWLTDVDPVRFNSHEANET